MNVDLAQGLDISDIFRAQPPVKSRDSCRASGPAASSTPSSTRPPSHAAIRAGRCWMAADGCWGSIPSARIRMAEMPNSIFAVSLRELLPFLRDNGVEPVTNALPCRSIDDLNAEERQRMVAQQAEARERLASTRRAAGRGARVSAAQGADGGARSARKRHGAGAHRVAGGGRRGRRSGPVAARSGEGQARGKSPRAWPVRH